LDVGQTGQTGGLSGPHRNVGLNVLHPRKLNLAVKLIADYLWRKCLSRLFVISFGKIFETKKSLKHK
jgi:hypothetical protein